MDRLRDFNLQTIATILLVLVLMWGIRRLFVLWQRRQASARGESVGDLSMLKAVDFEKLEQELAEFDPDNSPFSTSLFPSDLHLLTLDGYEVVQLVTGNVCYSMGLKGVTNSIMRAMRQGEMPAVTRMLNDGRLIARNRMVDQAKSMGADGVVGVTFQDNSILDFTEVTAIGTAVKKVNTVVPLKDQPQLDIALN